MSTINQSADDTSKTLSSLFESLGVSNIKGVSLIPVVIPLAENQRLLLAKLAFQDEEGDLVFGSTVPLDVAVIMDNNGVKPIKIMQFRISESW